MSAEALRTPAHVEEFVELVTKLRTTALDPSRRNAPADPAADARAGRTSAGLRMMYTARPAAEGADGIFVHHLSLSMAGGFGTAGDPAVGPFALLALKLLRGLPHADGMYVSENGVFHAEWALSPEGEQAYAASPPPILAVQRLTALLALYDACSARAFARTLKTGISPGFAN